MLNTYISTASELANSFYGIPFLVVSTLISLAFIVLVLKPLQMMAAKSNAIRNVRTNNHMFQLHFGLPMALVLLFTLGMNVLAFVNVIQRITGLNIIP